MLWSPAGPSIEMDDEPVYQPQDAIRDALKTSLITGSGGLLFAAVQNTLVRQNIGAMGVFTRFGGTIGMFGRHCGCFQRSPTAYMVIAAVGGTFEFVSTASANLRRKKDPYNQAIGGFCAGSVVGLSRTLIS